MSPADDHIPERDDDLLAAEYVLGVLPADEREAAIRRIESDAGFARLVEGWEGRLAPMAAEYSEIAPPPAVKAAVERRLFGRLEPKRTGLLWNNLLFWRGLSLAAITAFVLALATLFLAPPTGPQSGDRLVASLAADASDVHYLAIYDPRTAEVRLSHVSGERAAGRDFELWVIDNNQPPVSLGVIPVGTSVHLVVGDATRREIESGAVLAISLEPAGGSPTGQPTGPVVAAGDLKSI